MSERFDVDRQWLASFCARWHVRKLSLFGSVIRPDFDDASDIDVLIEFVEGRSPGFFGIAQMERELSEALQGRQVDIRTPGDLSPYFRDEVLRSARVQYASS